MAAKHDQSKTKQQSSVANTTNNVTKTIADSMNTTLNYVTNVTNAPAGAGAASGSLLPVAIAGGLGAVLLIVMAFLKK
jgi:hypothetical protein